VHEQKMAEDGEAIQIKVKDQQGEEVAFKVKKTTKMGKIFDAYAQRKGIQRQNLRFMVDGERINEDDTPKMLELEDEDQIEVALHQVGGGDGGDGEAIQIKVKDQAGDEMAFKVKKTTKMGKIFDAYSQRKGVARQSLRFLLDGKSISQDDTPKMLELEEDDQIDVYLEQVGGGVDGGDDGNGAGSDTITIKVRDATGDEVSFKVKKLTKMSKIFDAYAAKKGVETRSLRFKLDGESIHGDHTPKMLELEDGDQVRVCVYMKACIME